nr:hypothetical protein TetV2_00262 [Oceanusvirus sp.]
MMLYLFLLECACAENRELSFRKALALGAILDGVQRHNDYIDSHGSRPPPDVYEKAMLNSAAYFLEELEWEEQCQDAVDEDVYLAYEDDFMSSGKPSSVRAREKRSPLNAKRTRGT